MRRIAILGMAVVLVAAGCQVPAQAGGTKPSPNPSASAPATVPVTVAFSHVHVAEVGDAAAATVVCRSEAELAAALKARGLDAFPDSAETIAKALQAVDFTKKTAILVDLGLQPSMTVSVTPVGATAMADGITVRYAASHSEIDLPALNRPYAILTIPKTDKPVTVQAVTSP